MQVNLEATVLLFRFPCGRLVVRASALQQQDSILIHTSATRMSNSFIRFHLKIYISKFYQVKIAFPRHCCMILKIFRQ